MLRDAFCDRNGPDPRSEGPPGSGKTSTIAAAVREWDARRDTVWIAAQSNVAVKNIAEKLVKVGVTFRLLVSKEFHFEWYVPAQYVFLVHPDRCFTQA
jgi:hypothetical protein